MQRIKLKKQLREYQKEALDYALSFNDAVCVMPTGVGKTLVGIAWVVEHLNRGNVKRVLVLEPSRFLVEQTYNRYLEDTTLSKEDINFVYGFITKDERERNKVWKKGIIVVCTPHTAFNDINQLQDFDAVVIDECHHTTGKYPYVKLLSKYPFKYRLGLTATLSGKIRYEVEVHLSKNIRVWTQKELKERFPQYKFPDWIGEIYDAELEEEEIEFLKKTTEVLSTINTKTSKPFYLLSFCLRTFTRDGALALKETLNNPKAKISEIFPQELKKELEMLRELHKLKVMKSVLAEHDFEKAIVFVDRVCVAKKIFESFPELNPLLFLGRLRIGSEKQKEVIKRANMPEHKLIISTSAAEEGVDLPDADLLIIWSNVASPIRFIQRHGRIMRPSEKLKIAVFIATPGTEQINSPDYDSLVDGILLAKENGLDITGLEDEKFIKILKTKSYRKRIKSLLEGQPLSIHEIANSLGIKEKGISKVKKWLSVCLKEDDETFRIFYFYHFPYEEIKNEIDKFTEEYRKEYGEVYENRFKRFVINFISRLTKKNRLYVSFLDAEYIEFEDGFSQYFPSPKDLAESFFLEYKINKIGGGKKKTIIEGSILFDKNKFQVWLHSFEVISVDKEDFDKIIERIYQHVDGEYVEILFFTHGSIFLPTLYFNGRFNKKTLELTFRNAFYILLNMENLLNTT